MLPRVEGMSAQANHDHSVQLRQRPQVRAQMSDDTTAITAIPGPGELPIGSRSDTRS